MDEQYDKQMGYYCVIASPVAHDNDLSSDEKMLFGYISGLANKEGYCYASNDYLAGLFRNKKNEPKDKTTIIRWLNHLEDRQHIHREIIYHKENPNQVVERRIYIIDKFVPRMALEGVSNV